MSFQNSMAKESYPYKIISLAMLHLHHTKYSNHAQPRWQGKQLFHTFDVVKPFQLSRNTWAWAMDIALIGGIEYDDGGYVEKTKKEKVSHQLGVSTGYGDAH